MLFCSAPVDVSFVSYLNIFVTTESMLGELATLWTGKQTPVPILFVLELL